MDRELHSESKDGVIHIFSPYELYSMGFGPEQSCPQVEDDDTDSQQLEAM